jgi:predicted MPP superfamily phosphohydrolase
MVNLALAVLCLGEFALLLDLGNRLFGTYVRTPTSAAFRILLVTSVLIALAFPAAGLFVDVNARPARLSLYLGAAIASVAFLFFLFPYRRGIRPLRDNRQSLSRVLVKGIVLHEFTVALPEFPQAAEALSCLVLTDLHCNRGRQLALIKAAVAELRDDPVDFVFILGDLGENVSLLPEVLVAINDLVARRGKFCVLGNHDQEGNRLGLLLNLLEENHVRVLIDEYHEVEHLGVSLFGVGYPPIHANEVARPTDRFVIALTHSPDSLPDLARAGVGIAFAGHTHGGKVRIPCVGALLVPSKLGRFLDEGWFKCGTTLMYVSRGIGYFPGRFGNVGEICRVILSSSLKAG